MTPPSTPHGQLRGDELGEVSVAIAFPAELTSWSHVSARLEFSLRGANVSARTFEVRNHPLSPGSRTQNVILQSPHARSPSLRRTESVVADEGASQLSINMHSLDLAEDPADPFVDDGDEPEIEVVNFVLADLPDPVFPQVGGLRGPREPLLIVPPRSQAYYVVIKGYKIGIFLEKWYFNLQHNHFAILMMMNRTEMEKWVINGGGYVRRADSWQEARNIWDNSVHERKVLRLY